MTKGLIAIMIAAPLALTACATNQGVRGAGVGAGVGAVAGAIIGNNVGSGNAETGALIGAGVGAAAGAALWVHPSGRLAATNPQQSQSFRTDLRSVFGTLLLHRLPHGRHVLGEWRAAHPRPAPLGLQTT